MMTHFYGRFHCQLSDKSCGTNAAHIGDANDANTDFDEIKNSEFN